MTTKILEFRSIDMAKETTAKRLQSLKRVMATMRESGSVASAPKRKTEPKKK
jgi:hypothetical protein